jgi:two-component system, chemotaxis family, sensor kinase CheA
VPEQITVLEVSKLELVIPQGGQNGGPVYEDFVADALDFLKRNDVAGLSRAVRSLIDLSNPGLWLSSALRWLQVMLESEPVDSQAVQYLVTALRTLEVPDWSVLQNSAASAAVAASAPAATPVAVPVVAVAPEPNAENSLEHEALMQLLDVQREVLSLPDDSRWLAGRIKASAKALGACLRAQGRASELPALTAALTDALDSQTAQPLYQWMTQAFPATDAPSAQPAAVHMEAGATSDSPYAAAATPALATVDLELHEPAAAPSDAAPVADADLRLGKRNDEHQNAKSLKVDQVKIDRLMNLIGEMVVAKNAIPYLANRAETHFGVRELSREIKAQYAVINRISEEMQDAIMQVRMMPVSFVFQRFPRLIRDISKRLGKDVQLVLEGEDTAADKNIIESLGDPLIHMVRNSLDHGLEMPEVRKAAGKPVSGQLKISARQEADSVIIEISDDGKGIDPEIMKRKAYEKGLIDEQTLERISNQDAINLIFLPGFSTAEAISDLSGRGVGMDVVRTAIERVNGTISIQSTKGVGSSFRLTLPLSMAVTKVMTVSTDGQTFGIPMESVVETVRIARSAMRPIKQGLVTVLRGNVVPIKSLNRSLGLSAPPLANDKDELAVLVVRAGDATVGLMVDDFLETAEIILKPMAGILSSIRAYSGSALMGDGSVLMVLNVKEIV